MPRAKISEFSTIAGDNTDIDGINLAEGMAPSLVNDAIRELMAQLKDFQSGAAGDSITVVGTLAAKGTSSSGADLKLYEDTDNGTNYVGFIAPASIASNVQWTLPSADGSSGQALQTNGSGTLSFATLGISAGGTGQTTANAAFNALAPSQTSNAGRYLKTDGTNTSWDLLDISTADITGTLPVANGGTGITSFGTGVATALGINVGSSGAFVTNGGALGTPSSGTVTNLTGTASININGTVGATTPTTGAFTTLSASGNITVSGGTANGVAYLNGSKVLTTGSALSFDGTNFGLGGSADAWSGTYRALQVNGTVPVFGSQTQYMHVLSNAYNDGSWKYKVSSAAARYTQDIGVHYWDTAVVGTAGAALTWNEQMRLTSTGLGIGATPSVSLEVLRSGNAYGLFRGGSATVAQGVTVGQSTAGDALLYNGYSLGSLQLGTNGTERLRITSAGDVGIGTSSPGAKLDVQSSATTIVRVKGGSGTGQGSAYFVTLAASGSTLAAFGDRAPILGGTPDQTVSIYTGFGVPLTFDVGNSTKATIDSSGNLGLGVTPSSASAVVRSFEFGQRGVLWATTSTSNSAFATNAVLDASSNWVYKQTGAANAYQQDGQHRWLTAPSGTAGNAISFTQAMTLTAGGALGIGVTSPARPLEVNGTIRIPNGSSLEWGGVTTAIAGGSNTLQFFTNSTERARITSGGQLLVGTTTGTFSLSRFAWATNARTVEIENTNASLTTDAQLFLYTERNTTNNTYYYFGCYNGTAGAWKLRIADSGDVTNTNGTYGTISDAKMKTDIVDAGSQWADIKAIRFRKFKMKDDPSGLVQLGVVAQELEQISPGLVDEHTDRDKEGNDLGTTTKSVKTSVLLMKAAVALQEAMARIEQLEAKVAALEAK